MTHPDYPRRLRPAPREDFAAVCMNSADAEGGLWYQNGMITEKGTVYCVVPR